MFEKVRRRTLAGLGDAMGMLGMTRMEMRDRVRVLGAE